MGEPATSQVEYGIKKSYGSTSGVDPALVTAHAVTLTGLAPGVNYHYRVSSTDAVGNRRLSRDATFPTPR